MSVRQYIGARYVTKIYENSNDPSSAEWEANVNYEPLVMVTYNNGSYLSKQTVPASIGDPASNPTYWVQTGFYNGQIASLQNQIDGLQLQIGAINGTIGGINSDINDINKALRSGRNVIANLILNYIYDSTVLPAAPQGGCYVKNDLYVQYYSNAGDDGGVLICYELSTHTEVWRHSLGLYHGNSITYNPYNNKLYVCGCVGSGGYNNLIFVIDFDNPSIVESTLSLPNTTIVYSLTFDRERREFYSINNLGTTPGVADVLYIYNETLDTEIGSITLEDFPAVKYGLSTQGVQLAINGVAYILEYTTEHGYIIGYDVTTGKCVSIFALPIYASECRKISELQSIAYDYVNNRMFIGFTTVAQDLSLQNYSAFNLAEIDAFKGVELITPSPTYNNNRAIDEFTIENGYNTLKPIFITNPSKLQCAADAFNYAKTHDVAVCLLIGTNSATPIVYRPRLAGLSIRFQGAFEIYCLDAALCHLEFVFCSMIGGFSIGTNQDANVRLQNCIALFQQCTFKDFVSSASTKNHLAAQRGSYVVTAGSVYEGSFVTDVFANIGTTIDGVFNA